jgi:hypothetical protein
MDREQRTLERAARMNDGDREARLRLAVAEIRSGKPVALIHLDAPPARRTAKAKCNRSRSWPRLYLTLEEGSSDLTAIARRAALNLVRERLGAPYLNALWSQNAGCTCGCSPGWVLAASGCAGAATSSRAPSSRRPSGTPPQHGPKPPLDPDPPDGGPRACRAARAPLATHARARRDPPRSTLSRRRASRSPPPRAPRATARCRRSAPSSSAARAAERSAAKLWWSPRASASAATSTPRCPRQRSPPRARRDRTRRASTAWPGGGCAQPSAALRTLRLRPLPRQSRAAPRAAGSTASWPAQTWAVSVVRAAGPVV